MQRSLFRNVRGSLFNHTTQTRAVNRFAQVSTDIKSENRRPFMDANMSIKGAERIFKTKVNKSGLKDEFFESQLQHRMIGRDAMIQARESERRNENNPLLRTVETKPVTFTRREVKVVERESKEMERPGMRFRFQKNLPLAESSEMNIGNTWPDNPSNRLMDYKQPKNFTDLPQIPEGKEGKMFKNPVPAGKKRKAAYEGPNMGAPGLGKKARQTDVNMDTLVARTNADLYCRSNVSSGGM